MEVYETVKSIGSGSFGQVYLVRHKYEEKNYVVKKVKTRDMSQKDRENTEQEVRLLQKLRHSNIVAYKDSYIDRDQYLCIVMVYCEGGDVYTKIKSNKGKKFTEAQVLSWLAQTLLALLYLHERRILHRDLKTQNIFLKNDRVKLGDFGIAKVLDGTKDFANTCIGTPYYMSPELFKNRPYSYKSDVWALGCVVYEMCNLRHAFDAQSLNGLAMKILKGSYPPPNQSYSKVLRDLVTKMLSVNPKDRPTLIDVLNVPIVKRATVNYLRDSFKTPQPGEQIDVDDLNVDSLREQAEKYQLMSLVTGEVKSIPAIPSPQGPNVVEAKLKREETEKAELEDKLRKLEKQISVKKKLQQAEEEKASGLEKMSQQRQQDAEARREMHLKEKKRRANSIGRKQDQTPVAAPQQVQPSPKLPMATPPNQPKPKVPRPVFGEDRATKKSDDLSTAETDDLPLESAKDRVLKLKELRRQEEEQRHNEELKLIRAENSQKRKFASEMRNAVFRTSSSVQDAMTDYPSAGGDTKGEEDRGGMEEVPEESPEDVTDLEQQYKETKEKLIMKTMKIEELKSSLLLSPHPPDIAEELEQEFEDFDEEIGQGRELESVEEVEEEEVKDEQPTVQSKVKEKIKTLTQYPLHSRCEAGLGNSYFQRAYSYLQIAKGTQDETRSALIEILGENNIGYWAILDQLVFLEQYLQSADA